MIHLLTMVEEEAMRCVVMGVFFSYEAQGFDGMWAESDTMVLGLRYGYWSLL